MQCSNYARVIRQVVSRVYGRGSESQRARYGAHLADDQAVREWLDAELGKECSLGGSHLLALHNQLHVCRNLDSSLVNLGGNVQRLNHTSITELGASFLDASRSSHSAPGRAAISGLGRPHSLIQKWASQGCCIHTR